MYVSAPSWFWLPKKNSMVKNKKPITLHNTIGHFLTITRHKRLVMKGCFAVGLYRQGLFHDLSKYAPSEFFVGARYFQGNRSPNNAERDDIGVSTAWLHHKGRNKHHYEYWMDYNPKGANTNEDAIVPMKMPGRYVVEMFVDRVAASKVYQKDAYTDSHPLQYFERAHKNEVLLHKETYALLHKLLKMLAEEGEEKTYAYIKRHLYRKKW